MKVAFYSVFDEESITEYYEDGTKKEIEFESFEVTVSSHQKAQERIIKEMKKYMKKGDKIGWFKSDLSNKKEDCCRIFKPDLSLRNEIEARIIN